MASASCWSLFEPLPLPTRTPIATAIGSPTKKSTAAARAPDGPAVRVPPRRPRLPALAKYSRPGPPLSRRRAPQLTQYRCFSSSGAPHSSQLAKELDPAPPFVGAESVVVFFVVFGVGCSTSGMRTSLEEGLRGEDLDGGALGVPDHGQRQVSAARDAEVLEVRAAGRHQAAALARHGVDIEVVLRDAGVVRHLGLYA